MDVCVIECVALGAYISHKPRYDIYLFSVIVCAQCLFIYILIDERVFPLVCIYACL